MKRKITICSGDKVMPLCIELLISRLQSEDGAERIKARKAIVKIGSAAVPYIIPLLSDPKEHIRWEACKTLQQIRDPNTARPLVSMLMDDNMDVRWVAANALIELEQHAIIPLLEGIEENFESFYFRESAHHVLHALRDMHLLDEKTEAVMRSLNISELPSTAAFTAFQALDYLRSHPASRHRQLAVF